MTHFFVQWRVAAWCYVVSSFALFRAHPSSTPALRLHIPSRQVPLADVESWVVQAIAEGLIDARMDQATSLVTVTRATQREFGTAQWAQLHTKLRAWRDSVSGLLALVDGKGRE